MDRLMIEKIKAGMTFSAIGKLLGKTRSAIAGRKFRLVSSGSVDLPPVLKDDPSTADAVKENVSSANRRKAARLREKKAADAKPTKAVIRKEEKVDQVRVRDPETNTLPPARVDYLPLSRAPKPIFDLKPMECKAPVGKPPTRPGDGVVNPHLFCAEPVPEGETYCKKHKAVFFNGRKPIKTNRHMFLPRTGSV